MYRPLLGLSAAALITLGGIFALGTATGPSVAAQARNPLTGDKPTVRPAPEWRNTSWLNTPEEKPVTLTSLEGRVVLLNFWTFTCWNCTGAIPSMVEYDRRYRAQGLTVIGIHRPEFPPYAGEHDKNNVAGALRKYHIEYANAQDNNHATWDLYDIQYWPSYVLIDRRGNIRYKGHGEFHLDDPAHQEWDDRIRTPLAER